MDLPHLFSSAQQGKITRRLFFALDIGEEVITAGLWSVQDGNVSMLKTSSPIEWEGENPSDVIEAADVALEELGQEDKINEVMFGLPSSWVPNGGISEDKKKVLKELCEKLMVKPVGYVVTTEALNRFLCEQEGGPLNAIFIEYTSTSLTISLVKAGKIERTESVGRSTDSTADLLEGLARFGAQKFPLQILIYSARMKLEELEHEKQTLLSHDWQGAQGFQHIPNIDVLAQKIMIEAVCIAGGSAVAHSLGLSRPEAQAAVQQEVRVGTVNAELATDVQAPTVKPRTVPVIENTSAEFGFQEVGEHPQHTVPQEPPEEPRSAVKPEPIQEVIPGKKLSLPSFSLPKLPPLPKIRLPRFGFPIRLSVGKLGILLVVLAVVITAGLFIMKSQSKARIVAILKTTPVRADVTFILSTSIDMTDPDALTLKAEEISEDVKGEKTGPVTGVKQIGDKATGTVTVYNATSSEKVFPAGTVLTAPNGLKFLLDEDVTVASSSGTASSVRSGTADVQVTAEKIGADSNFGENTEFTVANFDKLTYVAKNEKAFGGGSSREVQVVSQADMTRLEQSLISDLKQQALDALKEKHQDNAQLVILDTGSVREEQFSADEGKEAQTLSLSMVYAANALTYSLSDLSPIAEKQFAETLPENSILQAEKTVFDVSSVSAATESGEVTLIGTLSSFAIPTLDVQALKETVAGKTVPQARAVITDRSEVSSATVNVSPSIVQLIFNAVPKDPESIALEIRVE